MSQAAEFNPLDPAQRENPFPTYARSRREQPVFYAPAFDLWVVTRYSDVLAVLKDHRTFSSVGALKSRKTEHPAEVKVALDRGYPQMPFIIDVDPPLHDRIRGLVTKAFTPRRVAEMEPRIEAIVRSLIADFAPEGRVDIIDRFAWPLPLRVLGAMLGIPDEDLPRLHEWGTDWLMLYQEAAPAEQLEHARGFVEMQRYFVEALEEREREPRDDLMSALLEARLADDPPLGIPEVAGVPLDLMVAGHVTVTRAIGSALVLLLDRSEEPRLLVSDPEAVPLIVEEVLRLESPAQGLFRTTTRDVEVGGARLPKGARVMVHFGSANRDELVFRDPDRFDFRREELGKHVAFGKGIHFCIGAPLARIELRVALPLLLRNLPNLRLADEPFERETIFFARGFRELHVEWDPEPDASRALT
jgi:cytochrome P450